MRDLQTDQPAELLVGTATGDDAAVWRLDDDRALISTADFITPVVDDARTWGRVAAANSVSDVYAMGGRPLFALNLVGWNVDALPMSLLGEVLEKYSLPDTRTDMGRPTGQTARMALNTSRGNRSRFSTLPPYSSVSLFVSGDRNDASR